MKKILLVILILITGNLFSLGPTTETEKDGVILITEERKLAMDIYGVLYQTWGADIFNKLHDSEEFYLNNLNQLIAVLGIKNPTLNKGLGEYSSVYITNLYKNFYEKGNSSAGESYRIAATIQELIISDINTLLENTNNEDIISVLNTNRLGAIGHIRVCNREIKKLGMTYQAQFLSNMELNAILLD